MCQNKHALTSEEVMIKFILVGLAAFGVFCGALMFHTSMLGAVVCASVIVGLGIFSKK